MLVLVLSLGVVLLDQVTKHVIYMRFGLGEYVRVTPFFSIRYVQNTGAAWGMFQGLNAWLIGLSVVMLAVIVGFRRAFIADRGSQRVAVALMLAGIAGNLIDRVRLGYVIDFFDFHWGASHFPAFNVADAAICTGIGLYMLSQALQSIPGRPEAPAGPGPGA